MEEKHNPIAVASVLYSGDNIVSAREATVELPLVPSAAMP